MARYLETLLRHRMRFLILCVLAPLSLGGSSALLLRSYEATATLWISDPSYLGQTVAPIDWSPRQNAAQNATETLRQLLATHTFDQQVADKLQATGGLSGPRDRTQVGESLGSALRPVADGTHLVRLTYSNPNQGAAVAVLRTTIDLYLQHQALAQQNQLDVSTTFLSSQVTSAESAAALAQQAVAGYVAAHPGVHAPAGAADTGIAEFDRLLHQLRQTQDDLAKVQAQLAQARFLGAAAQRMVETNTQVVDQPRVATAGLIGDGSSLTAALTVSLLCLLAAVIYLSVLVWADQTARDGKELERRLKVPVLTTIPLISLQERF
jgi:uncharacterized protein involved in exopolysaccharide biosynthesis